ncbi:MAG: hypothetical protein AAF242_07050 [Bacteroidota bacterium]
MNTIQFTLGIATLIIGTLIALLIFAENPEKAIYQDTVRKLMEHEDLRTYQELIKRFPQLKVVDSKLERIGFLKKNIYQITGGPAPNPSAAEQLQIQYLRDEIQLLQAQIKGELALLSKQCP